MGWSVAINYGYASTSYANGATVATYYNDSGSYQKITSFGMRMGTGSGTFTWGNRVRGNGGAISASISLGGNGVTITNVVKAIKGSGGYYANRSQMVGYDFTGINYILSPGTSVSVVIYLSGGTCWTVDKTTCWGGVEAYNPERTVTFNSNNAQNKSNSKQTSNHACTMPNATAYSYVGDKFTVSFNGNKGTTPTASKVVQQTFAKKWKSGRSSGSTYITDLTYTFDSDTTVYAQWTNPSVSTLPTPTRTGYVFKGWYTASSGGTLVTTDTIVSGDVTFYAQWVSSPVYIRSGGTWIRYVGGSATTSNVNYMWKYINGKWTRSGKVYKRVNGAWVQQIGDQS